MTYLEYLRYVADVESFYRREEIRDFSCVLDDDGDTKEPFFSWLACECCNRPNMGGSRYHVIARHEPSGDILNFNVCPDCVYFNEYGRLDDSTMLDVERDRERNRNAFRYHMRRHGIRASRAIELARLDAAENRKRYPGPIKRHAGVWQTLDSMPRYASSTDRAYYCDE